MQVWFEFDDGKPVAVTTDMVVRNARLQLPSTASGAFSAESAAAARQCLAGDDHRSAAECRDGAGTG